MVLQVVRSTAARGLKASGNNLITKRSMGGGAVKKDWEGIDKVVRGVFPKDSQGEFDSDDLEFVVETYVIQMKMPIPEID